MCGAVAQGSSEIVYLGLGCTKVAHKGSRESSASANSEKIESLMYTALLLCTIWRKPVALPRGAFFLNGFL
jgi:hypothetical protein